MDIVPFPWKSVSRSLLKGDERTPLVAAAPVTLIGAHALLHRQSRSRNGAGATIATIEDYAVARELEGDARITAALGLAGLIGEVH